jgi:hypothetical protein
VVLLLSLQKIPIFRNNCSICVQGTYHQFPVKKVAPDIRKTNAATFLPAIFSVSLQLCDLCGESGVKPALNES